jgi:hypothetical protein
MLSDTKDVGIDTPRMTPREVLNALQAVTPDVYLPDREAHVSMFYGTLLSKPRVEDVGLVIPLPWYIMGNPDLWLYLAVTVERPASVEHSIYTYYYDVDQVKAIYVQILPKVRNVFVLLRQDHYDEELMDRLLDREEKTLDLYPNELFNFQYLPLLEDDHTRPVPENAILILSR